jgi:hypothetical protein
VDNNDMPDQEEVAIEDLPDFEVAEQVSRSTPLPPTPPSNRPNRFSSVEPL